MDDVDKLNCVSNVGKAIVLNDPLARIKLNWTDTTSELNDNGTNNDELVVLDPVVSFVAFVDENSDDDNSITDAKLPTYVVAASPVDDVSDDAGGTKLSVLLVDPNAMAIRGRESVLLLFVLLLLVVQGFGSDAMANETFTVGVTMEYRVIAEDTGLVVDPVELVLGRNDTRFGSEETKILTALTTILELKAALVALRP